MENSINEITRDLCTGCKMCGDICPKQAISFKEDAEGFWYPKVDENKCINCGLCSQNCPSVNSTGRKEDNHYPDVYSLWSKNDEARISSTSGGVFWEFAEWLIQNGGVVAGSRFGHDHRSAEHAIASNIEELTALKGSKYFQSDTAGIYKAVKIHLENGTKVLFCGTPCQVSALNAFLNKQYENLYTLDFICRSINSPKAFKAYIDELERLYSAKAVEVRLKDKTDGWHSLATKVTFANGKVSLKDKNSDHWVRGFIYNDLYTRESCYHCQYKVIPRASADLTIGDFWGIKGQTQNDMFKGISVMLINSDKGRKLFDKVSDRFVYEKQFLEDALPGNPALLNNPVRTEKQDRFFEILNSGTAFSKAVDICVADHKPNIAVRAIKKFGRKFGRLISLSQSGISIPKFIYYNYFSSHIQRTDRAKILPHKNSVLNFDKGSKIILSGRDLEIGYNKLRRSRSETHLRMNENATWICKNGAQLFYNTVLEIKKDALFESGFFSMNGGSVIIIHKKASFGDDVMLGRNVIVYDSDFHSLFNKNCKAVNVPKPVIIEDHVWLTTNVMVQKGVTIGRGSLIAAYTVITKDIPPHSIVGGKSNGEVIKNWVHWDRNICPMD